MILLETLFLFYKVFDGGGKFFLDNLIQHYNLELKYNKLMSEWSGSQYKGPVENSW